MSLVEPVGVVRAPLSVGRPLAGLQPLDQRLAHRRYGYGGRTPRITTATDVKALADADFVVENVTEDWAAKSAVYRDLDRACRDGVAFAVNTSAIPITRVASVTGRPDRVLGMHFMNPVHLMPMVEMLRGHFTSPETVDLAHRLLATIGKEGILVEDAPGFVTNRVLMPIINEAIFAVQDGLATAEQVDRIFKGCFGTGWDPWKPATGLAWTRS